MKRRLASFSALVIAFLFWQLFSEMHVVTELFLPSPASVARALVATSPEVFYHAAATFVRAIGGLIIGASFGLCVGFLMNWNRWLHGLLDSIVEAIRPVPAVAALPLMILWFGTGNGGQLLLVALSVGAIVAVDVDNAIMNVPTVYIKASQSLGAGRLTVFRTIILPAILPNLTAGLRVSATISLTVAVAAEFMGAQWGLGFLMMRARRTLETQTILLCTLMIGVLARALDVLIRYLMARLTRWSERSSETLLQKDGASL